MPSTLVHAFLPAACAATQSRELNLKSRVIFLLSAAFIANLPDIDVVGVILYPEFAELIHRNIGHNLLSLTILVIFGKWILTKLVRIESKQAFWYSLALVSSHVVLDAGCTHGNGIPAGVPLLWPFSEWEFAWPVAIFGEYQLRESHNWFLGHVLSSDFWGRAIVGEVAISVLIFSGFWLTQFVVKKIMKKINSMSLGLTELPDAAGPAQWNQKELENSPHQMSGDSFVG